MGDSKAVSISEDGDQLEDSECLLSSQASDLKISELGRILDNLRIPGVSSQYSCSNIRSIAEIDLEKEVVTDVVYGFFFYFSSHRFC